MPHVSIQNTMWTFTSPDGSQVERYIVEFECNVRNSTFVEKYTSVMANSGGTGRVARNVSCFGLGQLYRVKVWAVSGHNISQQPAVRCLTPDGQCRKGMSCFYLLWEGDFAVVCATAQVQGVKVGPLGLYASQPATLMLVPPPTHFKSQLFLLEKCQTL